MRQLVFLTYLGCFLVVVAGAVAVGWHFALARSAKGETRVYTCSMHLQVRNDGPGLCPICQMELQPLDSVPASKDGSITIDPVVVQNTGIRVHQIAKGKLVRTLDAFGSLQQVQPLAREITLKTRGWIEELFADTEGMAIAVGDPLFAIYSPDLILAQEELIAAKRGGDAALLAAAREKLHLLDVDAAQIAEIETLPRARRTVRYASPVAGTLLMKAISRGTAVEMGTAILRIADLSQLWLDAQIYEHQLGLAKKGLLVEATIDALPGRVLTGEVIFVAPTLDPETRTATLRIALKNPDGELKPGMYARVRATIPLAEDVVLVPREAILDSGRRQVAFVALAKGRFAPRVLAVGRSGNDGQVEVLSGLSAGELVVTSGHFLLDSESRLREGMQKLSPDDLLASRPSTAPLLPRIEVSQDEQKALDEFVLAYVALAERMAADAWDEGLASRLAKAVAALTGNALKPHHDALHAALQHLSHGDLAARRKAFVAVSDAAIALVSSATPSAAVGKTVIVVHCPMVPASWLQLREVVANPYEGSRMLTCGDITTRIQTRMESGK